MTFKCDIVHQTNQKNNNIKNKTEIRQTKVFFSFSESVLVEKNKSSIASLERLSMLSKQFKKEVTRDYPK